MRGCSPSIPSASIPDRSGAAPTLPRRQGERRRDRKGAWAVTRSPVLMTASSPAGHCLALTFSQEVSRNRTIPFAATDLVPTRANLPAAGKHCACRRAASASRCGFAMRPATLSGPSHFGHCAEWVILDMERIYSRCRIPARSVDALDTHITAPKPVVSQAAPTPAQATATAARLRPGAGAVADRACLQKLAAFAFSGTGPNHRPISRR